MLKIDKVDYSSTGKLLDATLDVLEHYGFEEMDDAFAEYEKPKNLPSPTNINFSLLSEKRLVPLVKEMVEKKFHLNEDKKMFYHVDDPKKGATKSSLGIHIAGTDNAFSEATLITAIGTVLKSIGIDNFIVHINSIGDRESKRRFVRHLNTYFKGLMNEMPAYARTHMSQGNPIKTLLSLSEKQHPIAFSAPDSMEYLNDESRSKFREILEYLENIGIQYEINPQVVGGVDTWSDTIFEFRVPEDGSYTSVAHGGRYNELVHKGFRKEMGVAGAFLNYEIVGKAGPKKRKKNKPSFYLAHLGQLARMRALRLMDILHESKVQIRKSINTQGFGSQLDKAAEYKVPYIIIIGHKEALEDTVLVRNTKTNVQKAIAMNQLPGYISRLKV